MLKITKYVAAKKCARCKHDKRVGKTWNDRILGGRSWEIFICDNCLVESGHIVDFTSNTLDNPGV